jgi:hypothetical protein
MTRLRIARTMSKARSKTRRSRPARLRAEYTFDYAQARSNRFAGRMRRDAVAVVLEPDVASVFGSSAQVNTLLRSVISSLPKGQRPSTRPRRKAG